MESAEEEEDKREESESAEVSAVAEDVQESVQASAEAEAVSVQPEPGEAEPETEEPRHDLIEVAATVTEDADVRVRPGLAWRVIDRLSAGDSLAVLQEAGGWYRIRYADGQFGWVRTTALDLRAVDASRVLELPAAPLVAEWRGERYGVIGQSADGVEVRLLKMEAEQSEMVGAPIGEVRLIEADVTLEELPILIADETVVFPGDDFRVGQGKILPKADEWMWLDDGTLLAHNETHIWRWRPETDELRLTPRPPGLADFSPNGRNLGIATCGSEESCHPYLDVTIMPLDGSPAVSLMPSLERNAAIDQVRAINLHSPWYNPSDLDWSADDFALLLSVQPMDGIIHLNSVVLDLHGRTTILQPTLDSWEVGEGCAAAPSRGLRAFWRWHTTKSVVMRVLCEVDDDEWSSHLAIVEVESESLHLEPWDVNSAGAQESREAEIDSLERLVAYQLGVSAFELRGGTDRYGVVIVPDSRQLFILDRLLRELQLISVNGSGMPDRLWEMLELGRNVGYLGWDLYWSLDRQLVVVSRTGTTHVAAGLVIDLTTATATSLQIGSVRTWPCYPTGGWNPDSSVFQVEFEGYSSYVQLEGDWIDGTAAPNGVIAQRLFVSSTGEAIAVLRARAGLRFGLPSHLGGWSGNGDWFAIGGHQRATHCYVGD